MDKIKLVLLAFGLSLVVGACSNMGMGGDDPAPAAGPTETMEQEQDTGLTESPTGEMEDTDDQEGAGATGGGTQ